MIGALHAAMDVVQQLIRSPDKNQPIVVDDSTDDEVVLPLQPATEKPAVIKRKKGTPAVLTTNTNQLQHDWIYNHPIVAAAQANSNYSNYHSWLQHSFGQPPVNTIGRSFNQQSTPPKLISYGICKLINFQQPMSLLLPDVTPLINVIKHGVKPKIRDYVQLPRFVWLP